MSMQEAEEQVESFPKTHAESATHMRNPTSLSSTRANARVQSGISIKIAWLAHSNKKKCDLCRHPYAFTKVYAPDMPSSLPPLLLIKRLLQQLFWALFFVLRSVAVASIWLGVLPLATVWTLRLYFRMGESIAWWISDPPRPPSTESPLPFYSYILFSSSSLSTSTPASAASRLSSPTSTPTSPLLPLSLLPTGFLAKIGTHPLWLTLWVDIFAGQVIASLIVLMFVAIFMLRDWILQNARPGVFEEAPALVPPIAPAPVPATGAAEGGEGSLEGLGSAKQGRQPLGGLAAAQNDDMSNARLTALIHSVGAAPGAVGGEETGPLPPEARALLEHSGHEKDEEFMREFMARQRGAGVNLNGIGVNNREYNNANVIDLEIAADLERWSTADDDHRGI
ncbi:hypothetical protein CVT26_013518, partial [Gymnopilus dilepis]